MSNTFTGGVNPYNPYFYAQEALIVLEKSLGMARRVHNGYDAERRSFNKGEYVQLKRPSSFSTTIGGTSTTSDVTPEALSIQLDTWRQVRFGLTDKELAYTTDQIIQDHIAPATYALAYYMESSLTNLYKYVPWYYGASSTISALEIINARKVIRDNAGPIVDTDMLHFAIDSTMEANFLNLGIFHQAQIAGASNQEALLRGSLGTRFGVESFVQQTMTTSHVIGTAQSSDTTATLNGNHTINATTLSINGLTAGTKSFKAGDTFILDSAGGETQRYAVTADSTISGNAIAALPIWPALKKSFVSGKVLTFETRTANRADAYWPNLMFHRNAFAFVCAPLPQIGEGAGAKMAVVTDPRTGLSIRSRLGYDDKIAKVNITLDVLYGVKCLDPNLACIVRRDV